MLDITFHFRKRTDRRGHGDTPSKRVAFSPFPQTVPPVCSRSENLSLKTALEMAIHKDRFGWARNFHAQPELFGP